MAVNEPTDKRDRVIADTGWGIKPDDQPANAEGTPPANRRFDYSADTPDVIRAILTRMRKGFNAPNRVVVKPGRVTITDLNGDAFVIEGLSFGNPHLTELLRTVGAGFDPQDLRSLGSEFDGFREYSITKTWAWGAERTG